MRVTSHGLLLLAGLCWSLLSASAVPAQAGDVDFNRDIRPILAGNCFTCHGFDPAERKGGPKGSGGLRLDTAKGATADLGGYAAIVPGDVGRSVLLQRITATGAKRMPPSKKGAGLAPREIELLRAWIRGGAKFDEHWAFVAPVPSAAAKATPSGSATARIDDCIDRRLARLGIPPNPPADRAALLRRVTLDLTGLPPTQGEIRAFLADDAPDAYGRLVDRLLAADAYGEHFARPWLDLARYADSAGYADDPARTIWAYRDWVVQAFNANMPFDQFTIEQLAGDLLPNPTDAQRIATAFHRNTMTNSEGGTDDEEFRTVAIVDRVNTTMATWMGTTMGCAQCHDHKFDPLTQAEYFQLYAIFNTTTDSDKRNERPLLRVMGDADRQRRDQLRGELARLEQLRAADDPGFAADLEAWDRSFPRRLAWRPLAVAPAADAGSFRVAATAGQFTGLRVRRGGRPVPAREIGLRLRRHTPETVRARFVRITLPGAGKILSLAEVEVFAGGRNVALSGQASQSKTSHGGQAARAIDGNRDGEFEHHSVTHTAQSRNPWWEVDLHSEQVVARIVLWNRTGSAGLRDRLRGYRVELLDAERQPVWLGVDRPVPDPEHTLWPGRGGPLEIVASWTAAGRQVLVPAATVDLSAATLELAVPGKAIEIDGATEPGLAAFRSVPDAVLRVLQLAAAQRTAAQSAVLREYYRGIAPSLAGVRAGLATTRKALAALRPVTTVPVMAEQPVAQRRKTHIQIRGNYRQTGARVEPGVPAVFPPLPAGVPADRLALARWLVAPSNPLTARVIVNRYWELFFGTGLVATSDDFGTRGSLPTHPELLDDLAVEFVASQWDVKRLVRRIVMSAAYRRDSKVTAAQLERDPTNRWLGRGPRLRLSAEMIRDVALHLGGLLSSKMFGPPVRPPRPTLGLRAAFGGSTDWQASTGADRYRRAIYTFWQRSIPYPSMAAFDAPSREVCTVRRSPTNTPLQALVTLNDPVYVEAAQALARRMVGQGGDTPATRARFGMHLCVVRNPTKAEVARLVRLFEQSLASYRRDPAAAEQLATQPLGKAPPGADLAELAAWTVVANVLLNLDEVLVKR